MSLIIPTIFMSCLATIIGVLTQKSADYYCVNQRLSKLVAIRRSFEKYGMLRDDCHMSALREVEPAAPEFETGPGPDETNSATDENDDCGPVDGPQVLNHVVLARKKGG